MTDVGLGPDAILRAQGINKNFGAVVALENVSFAIPKGEIIGLRRRQRRWQVDASQDYQRRARA